MPLLGMHRDTGQPLSGIAHLTQSLSDLLSTPKGSRRLRPEYGSNLPRMVDQPLTPGWIASAQAEIARAIDRWEPRIRLKRAEVTAVLEGRVSVRISGVYQGETVLLDIRT